jgi:hypothetical protein
MRGIVSGFKLYPLAASCAATIVLTGGCAEKAAPPPPPVAAPAAQLPAAPVEPAVEPSVTPIAEAPPTGKVVLGAPDLTAGLPGEGPLALAEIQAWLDNPANHEPLDFDLPLGLQAGRGQVKGIDKNPLTRAKIELGRQLYFDPRLSADNSLS